MKFLHISDIHLGKRLHGCLLFEDHEAVLEQMTRLYREELQASEGIPSKGIKGVNP